MIRRKPSKPRVKTRRAITPYRHMVDVAGDGLLARPDVANGAAVPVVILDGSDRPDLQKVIEAHQYDHLNDGDTEVVWVGDPDKWIGLDIRFLQPVPTRAIVRLPMPKYAVVAHLALKSNALYIHIGGPSSKFSDYYLREEENPEGIKFVSEPIFLSTPPGGFEKIWDDVCTKVLTKHFRKEYMFSRDVARNSAEELVSRFNDLANVKVSKKTSGPPKVLYLTPHDVPGVEGAEIITNLQ